MLGEMLVEKVSLWTMRSALFKREKNKLRGSDVHVLQKDHGPQTCAGGSTKQGCLQVMHTDRGVRGIRPPLPGLKCSEKTRQQEGRCLLGSGMVQVDCSVVAETPQSIASASCGGVES